MPFGAILGAVGTIGGALISSSGQKKAASKAAAAQQQATDSQLQLGRENIGFQQGIYDQNKALLSPFVQRGNTAGVALNSLLGLGGQPAAANANAAPAGYQTAPVAAQEPLNAMAYSGGADFGGEAPGMIGFDGREGGLGRNFAPRRMFDQGEPVNAMQAQAGVPQIAQQPQAAAPNPQDAFNNFAHSAGIDFQLQQGTNAIANNAASRGGFQSGAALKALQNYGQNTALNNYFMPYLGLLQGQQATGAQSGAAIAGVGSNFGNTVSSIYGNQQGALQNNANAMMGAAAARGQAGYDFGKSVGSSLGTFGSALVNNNPFASGSSGYNAFNSSYTMPTSFAAAQPLDRLPGGFY